MLALCIAAFSAGPLSATDAGASSDPARVEAAPADSLEKQRDTERAPGSERKPAARAKTSRKQRVSKSASAKVSAKETGAEVDSAKASPVKPDRKATRSTTARKAPARKAPPTPQILGFRVKGAFSLDTIYDDNIFRFSDINIMEFRKNSRPEKFRMETYDDVILSPRLTLDLDRNLLGSGRTTFRIMYQRWQYLSNPNKTNEQWWFRIRQPALGRGAFELQYSYIPWYYIRELSDRPPFDSRVTPIRWQPFKAVRNAFKLSYTRPVTSRLSARVDGERVIRFYNQEFMENDNWEWNIGGTATVNLSAAWRLQATYTYHDVASRIGDSVGETLADTDNGDASYTRDSYRVGLRWRPKTRLWIHDNTEVIWRQSTYYFTSELPYFIDPYHRGRKDENWSFEVGAGTKPVRGPITLGLGYRRSGRSSTSSSSFVGADAIEEDKNYISNRFSLGMTYPF